MVLPDPFQGEIKIVTPVEDPCQFNPAWRSVIAGYFFNINIRRREDFEEIFKSGYCYVPVDGAEEGEEETKVKAKAKKKAKNKKPGKRDAGSKEQKPKRVSRPVEPFFSHPEFRPYANDKYILSQVEMMNESIGDRLPSLDLEPYRLAYQWYMEPDHEAAIKKRIEPMLLTGIGMDIATLDLLGVPSRQESLEVYEKLYFNCRDEHFNLNPSMQLIQRMAMPYGPLKTYLKKWEEIDSDTGMVIGDGRPLAKDSDIWKAIAATMGYEALMYTWRWSRVAHGMKSNSIENMIDLSWNVAVSKLFSALYTGDIAHEDAARVLSAFTAQSKKISDDRNNRGMDGENDTVKALMSVLYLAAPKMVHFSKEDEAARNEEIQSRIASQLAINKTAIEDKGKQVEAEIIDAQISEAVGNRG